jgi:hypothetical protein
MGWGRLVGLWSGAERRRWNDDSYDNRGKGSFWWRTCLGRVPGKWVCAVAELALEPVVVEVGGVTSVEARMRWVVWRPR